MRTKLDSSRKWLSLFGLVSAILCATSAKAATNPSITWATPSAITYPTALSSAQLNASANVAGSFSYSPDVGTVLDAGDRTLMAVFTPADQINYRTVTNTVTLTVNRAQLFLSPDNKSRQYGDDNPPLTAVLTGVVNGDDISYTLSTSAVKASPVGNYSISGALIDPNNRSVNYVVSLGTATLTVTKRALTITPNNITITYGEKYPTPLTATYTGLFTNEVFTAEYEIPDDLSNRGPDEVGSHTRVGNHTIRLKTLSVTILNGDQPDQTIAVYDRNASGSGTPGADGYNKIKDPAMPLLPNYTTTLQTGTLTILPRNLTITAGNAETTYGTPAVVGAPEIQGLITDDQSVISSTYTTSGSDPGTYTINPQPVDTSSDARLANYNVILNSGVLTITKGDQTIAPPSVPGSPTYGTPLDATFLNATNVTKTATGTVTPPPLQYYVFTKLGETGTPAAGAKPNAGVQIISVIAPETAQYKYASNSYFLTIQKYTPTITWSKPANITVGTPLTSAQLNATVTGVAGGTPVGTVVYDPSFGTFLDKGADQVLKVTAIQTENYNSVDGSQKITVDKGTPVFADLTDPEIPAVPASETVTFTGKITLPGYTQTAFLPAGEKVHIQVKDGDTEISAGDATIASDGKFSLDLTFNVVDKKTYTTVYTYDPATAGNPRLNKAVNDSHHISVGKVGSAITDIVGLTNAKGELVSFTYGTSTVTVNGHVKATSGTLIPSGTVKINFNGSDLTAALTPDVPNDVAFFSQVLQLTNITADGFVHGLNAASYPLTITYNGDSQFRTSTLQPNGTNVVKIDRAKLDVKMPDTQLNRFYGDAQTGSVPVDVTSQLKFSDTNSISVYYDTHSITPTSPIGVYSVLPVLTDTLGLLGNYELSQSTAFITNNPVFLEITPNSYDVVTNTPLPTLDYSVKTYATNGAGAQINVKDKLVNDEPRSVINPQPDIRTEATSTATEHAGYKVYITNAPKAANYTVILKQGTINVIKDKAFIQWSNPADIVYGTPISDTQLNVNTVLVKGTNAFAHGKITYNVAKGDVLHAGNQTLTATWTPNDGEFEVPYSSVQQKSVTLKVVPATLLIRPNNVTIGVNQPEQTVTPTYFGFVNSDSSAVLGYIDIAGNTQPGWATLAGVTSPTNALKVFNPALSRDSSTPPIVQNKAGTIKVWFTNAVAPDYTVMYDIANYSITNIPTTVSWSTPSDVPYGTIVHYQGETSPTINTAPQIVDKATGLPVPGTWTYDPKSGTLLTAGTVKLKAHFVPTDKNYGEADASVDLKVVPATLHVLFNFNTNKVYGDPNPALPAIPRTYTTPGSVGLYTNTDAFVSYDQIKNYIRFPGSSVPNVTVWGFVNAEWFTNFTNSAFVYRDVANNPVTAKSNFGTNIYNIQLTGFPNYDISYVDPDTGADRKGGFNIAKAQLTNTAASVTRVYGSTPDMGAGLTGTIIGIKTGDNITSQYTAPVSRTYDPVSGNLTVSPAGNYIISPNLIDPDNRLQNYVYTNRTGILTIAPAPLFVRADNKVKKPGTDNPTLTFNVDGFVNFQQITNNATSNFVSQYVPPTPVTTATKTSPIGNYPITFTGGNPGPNYIFNFQNGTLEVQTNRPPIARNDSYTAVTNDVTKIVKAKLLANDSDPDGDALTVSAFQKVTTRGGQVIADSTGLWLFYLPPAGATDGMADSFTYTASDGFGGTAQAVVSILLQGQQISITPKNLVGAKLNDDGSLFLRFSGITGRQYKVQATASFMNPIWQDLPVTAATVDTTKFTIDPAKNTITANEAGFIEIIDFDASTFSSRFYRSVVAQ